MPNNFAPAGSGASTSSGQLTPVANSSGNVAAGVATATLPAAAGKTTWIEGFDLTGGGATAASVVLLTITGLLAGTITMAVPVAAGVAAPMNAQGGVSIRFATPLPASAPNTAIVVSIPSLGAGNTNAVVNAYGFQSP